MMFHVGGILPLLVALATWVALPESPAFLAARDSASPQRRLIAGRIAGERFADGARFVVAEQRADKLPVRELFTSGRLAVTLALWVAFFGAFGMLNVVVSWTPAVLLAVGVPAAGAASVISFSNLAVVIGIGPAGQLVSRFGAGLTLVPALVLAALATWLMSQVQSTAQARP